MKNKMRRPESCGLCYKQWDAYVWESCPNQACRDDLKALRRYGTEEPPVTSYFSDFKPIKDGTPVSRIEAERTVSEPNPELMLEIQAISRKIQELQDELGKIRITFDQSLRSHKHGKPYGLKPLRRRPKR